MPGCAGSLVGDESQSAEVCFCRLQAWPLSNGDKFSRAWQGRAGFTLHALLTCMDLRVHCPWEVLCQAFGAYYWLVFEETYESSRRSCLLNHDVSDDERRSH